MSPRIRNHAKLSRPNVRPDLNYPVIFLKTYRLKTHKKTNLKRKMSSRETQMMRVTGKMILMKIMEKRKKRKSGTTRKPLFKKMKNSSTTQALTKCSTDLKLSGLAFRSTSF